ncbi:succinylglutamate desuccinylase/aspartoacylase family protein [Massilia sp. TS11]|uniref:succinylglutamate desuccinylase/aspartoacylase family protein n=1 Tax=Massilia sp. TS11 TaxID=2908003 RepID=UPI001EDA232A|nr:succinylglutamate desuccinylase/aspartoacylase family protein [Massilia sp. TS11]MCG2586223.1 M14 family metallopeptidase [Massilia sp. TS11]
MRTTHHPITLGDGNSQQRLTAFHFGAAGNGPKAYIQGGLHADEIPGMLAATLLRPRLEQLEREGRVRGEIILVPSANPIGLGQAIQGAPFGRFDLGSGINFNRAYKHVADELKTSLAGLLGPDAAANVALVRAHARAAIARWTVHSDAQAMKKILLSLAIDADVVLDLHCDNEAVVHLYAGTPLAERAAPLAALSGARALLLAKEAGDEPFDEACSRLWWELAEHFGPALPIPPACLAVTLELRGEMDVNYAYGQADADAVLAFLAHEGLLDLPPAPLPPMRCAPTPLEGVEPLLAPHNGIVVFVRQLGETVQAGDAIADLIDPVSGATTCVRAGVDGVFFARTAHRHLLRGWAIGKIAGARAYRQGKLLSQ